MSQATAKNADEKWVAASRQGDLQAFGRLVEVHQKDVHSLIFRLTNRHHTTDDLTQETFETAWHKLRDFRGTATFRTWLMKIALNKVRSYWRWKNQRRMVSLDVSPVESAWQAEDLVVDTARGSNPPLVSEDMAFEKNLQAALQNLPLRQREVVILRAQGLELHEVASTLGVAVGTVKAHLFQAKQKLQGTLAILL